MREGWCSWCWDKTNHRQITNIFWGRNTFECTKCTNETTGCLICSIAMVRSYGRVADPMCYKCNGSYASTNRRLKKLAKKAHCSWCHAEREHFLYNKGSIGMRDVYKCTACGSRIVTCRRCNVGLAKGHQMFDDECCSVCDGTFESWDKTSNIPNHEAWCSWCIEKTNHVLFAKVKSTV